MSSQNICSVANPSEIAHVSICQPSVLYGPYCAASCGAHFAGAEMRKPGGRLARIEVDRREVELHLRLRRDEVRSG
jgi:hypothetical protein